MYFDFDYELIIRLLNESWVSTCESIELIDKNNCYMTETQVLDQLVRHIIYSVSAQYNIMCPCHLHG